VGQDSWKSAGGSAIEIVPALVSNCLKAVYIAKPGEQFFEFPAWLVGDEVIYRIPKDISMRKLSYRETGYSAELTEPFTCDDEKLSRFCKMAQRTLYLTMRDNFMDCPCRERAQWPGDFVIQHTQIPYSMGTEALLLVRKAWREIFRWQRPNGSLYGPVPEGNWKMEIPAQMLAVVSLYGPWRYYLHSGDAELLKEIYPAARRYIDIWELDEQGLVKYRPRKGALPENVDGIACGGWDWLDWWERIDEEPLLNLWYICALQGVCRLAEFSGDAVAVEELNARVARLSDTVNQTYWNEEMGAYASEGWPHDPDDRTQAMAILSGVAGKSCWPRLKPWLLKVQQASPYMEGYVEEALFEIGAGVEALKRLKIRYSTMMDSGTNSLWELFHEDPDGTFNHSWSGGPATLLTEKVAGLYPVEAGWKSFVFRPNLSGLRHITTGASTPLGRVEVCVQVLKDGCSIRITIPKGARARIDLEALGGEVFGRESGEWDFFVKNMNPAHIAPGGKAAEVSNV
jgi:hypothetical protein